MKVAHNCQRALIQENCISLLRINDRQANSFTACRSHCYKRVALINPACLVVFTTVDVLKSIQLAMSGREDPYLQFALLPLGFVIIPSRTQQ
ncbi:hypothetical protein NC653_004839 [Populus alba x Populus x berolinensis]|uniref:HD-Zip IV C-terminal domain-containing protein n=1 Tax=Populus alba x Populus x berolinensis TaxID=444605 RepID=A0AAD6RW25_9ROSI|nr:hypothetical protein NC653_004839 [Populus alba x Populus x berolinensis]